MQGTNFQIKVWEKTKEIPKGRVSTYGEIAGAIGKPGGARAVGNALNKNPYAPKVPCHRVVAAFGKLGGFASGTENKIRILKKEGVIVKNNKIINFDKKFFKL